MNSKSKKSFRRAGLYTRFLTVNMVKEKKNNYSFPYTERHLQCLWYDNTWRPSVLVSDAGEEITVEYPGRWNLGAGPDFLDALLTIGPDRMKIKGDIEVHIHPNDWKHHGHSSDNRYDGVIAHVTYFKSSIHEYDRRGLMIQIPLENILNYAPGFSFENIDISSYPYNTLSQYPAPCSSILRESGPDTVISLLESAGEERLRIKSDRIAYSIDKKNASQVLYEEVMCSLGYKNNRTAFRLLADTVPMETLIMQSGKDPFTAYVLLLGCASLLPHRLEENMPSETKLFIRSLWDRWWKMKSRWTKKIMPLDAWCLAGLRPHNHPIRRMAAAAELFVNGDRLVRPVLENNTDDPAAWYARMYSLLTMDPLITYWNTRLSLSSRTHQVKTALIGRQRASSIIINVIIPFLAANQVPVAELLTLLPPDQDNSITRQAAFALLGPDHNPALYNTGLRQQGLIQIFSDFCLGNKGGCTECSLAKALRDSRDH